MPPADAPAPTTTEPAATPEPAPSLVNDGGAATPSAQPATPPPATPAADPAPAQPNAEPKPDAGKDLINGEPPAEEKAWYDGLEVDDDFLTDKIKSMGGVEDLLKAHYHQEKMLGQRSLPRPGENATPEQWQRYRESMGIPKSPDGYDITIDPAKLPDGMELSKEDLDSFRQLAHESDLTPQQAQRMVEYDVERLHRATEAAAAAQVAEQQQTVAKIKESWGDQYDSRLEQVREASRRTGLGEMLRDLGVGNSLAAVQALYTISQHLPEQDATAGERSVNFDSEINALKTSAAYMDRHHPAHQQTMKTLEDLYRRKVKSSR